jgi:hypothetical protein
MLVDGSWKNPNYRELAKMRNNGSFTMPPLSRSLRIHPSPFLGLSLSLLKFGIFSTSLSSLPPSTRELERFVFLGNRDMLAASKIRNSSPSYGDKFPNLSVGKFG